MATQVYIVEDHPLVRQVVSKVIEKMPGLSVCGAASSGEEALERLKTLKVDVVLIDMSLPQMSGLELLRQLQRRRPELPCLIFSGHEESRYVQAALAAGARGYLVKGRPAEIERAIGEVIAGRRYISEALRSREPGEGKQ